VDRYQFLQRILARLEQGGWSARTDSGWTSYDIEVFAHVLSRLRLLTVSEELEQGKRTFRCRIRAGWSLSAKLLFGAITGAALITTLAVAQYWPSVWLSLVLIPLAIWIIEDERQDYERHGEPIENKLQVEMEVLVVNDHPISKLDRDDSHAGDEHEAEDQDGANQSRHDGALRQPRDDLLAQRAAHERGQPQDRQQQRRENHHAQAQPLIETHASASLALVS